MPLGERIREIRLLRGLTQAELGMRVNMSGAAINRYENNLRRPDPETLSIIAGVLGVTADYLLGLTDRIILPVEQVSESTAGCDVSLDDPRVLEIAQELRQRNLPPEVLDKVVDLARALAQLEREHPAKNNKNRQK